jgi:hypothetical protein
MASSPPRERSARLGTAPQAGLLGGVPGGGAGGLPGGLPAMGAGSLLPPPHAPASPEPEGAADGAAEAVSALEISISAPEVRSLQHPAPRPRSLELISGLIRASLGDVGDGGGIADEDRDEILQMQEELAQLRAQHRKLPIHLRGRLPPPPPKHKPKFLGDYGQAGQHPGANALRFVSSGGGSRSSSKGGCRRPVTSHSGGSSPEEVSLSLSAADGAERKRLGGPDGAERKRLGAPEDGAPKGQAHAGEEGRAVAARAVLLSVRPPIEEGEEGAQELVS